ncbi:MAG: non-canonical purine NTP pyrophosphatase [Burkholderiaceae bacterium]
MQVVLASSNKGKLEELNGLLGGLGLTLAAQSEFGVRPCEEPFGTFLENALAKARHASASTGLAALADDSGLIVDELSGWAGVRSARLYEDWLDRQASLIEVDIPVDREDSLHFHTRYQQGQISMEQANLLCLIHLLGQQRRMSGLDSSHPVTARFVCVFAFVRAVDDPLPLIGQGQWLGEVLFEPRGQHGHGYDPIFFDPVRKRTAAELSLEEKNKCSHRARAARAFCKAFQT